MAYDNNRNESRLRNAMVRLAHENPKFRPHLLPLLKEGIQKAPRSKDRWGGVHPDYFPGQYKRGSYYVMLGLGYKARMYGANTEAENLLVDQAMQASGIRKADVLEGRPDGFGKWMGYIRAGDFTNQ